MFSGTVGEASVIHASAADSYFIGRRERLLLPLGHLFWHAYPPCLIYVLLVDACKQPMISLSRGLKWFLRANHSIPAAALQLIVITFRARIATKRRCRQPTAQRVAIISWCGCFADTLGLAIIVATRLGMCIGRNTEIFQGKTAWGTRTSSCTRTCSAPLRWILRHGDPVMSAVVSFVFGCLFVYCRAHMLCAAFLFIYARYGGAAIHHPMTMQKSTKGVRRWLLYAPSVVSPHTKVTVIERVGPAHRPHTNRLVRRIARTHGRFTKYRCSPFQHFWPPVNFISVYLLSLPVNSDIVL